MVFTKSSRPKFCLSGEIKLLIIDPYNWDILVLIKLLSKNPLFAQLSKKVIEFFMFRICGKENDISPLES